MVSLCEPLLREEVPVCKEESCSRLVYLLSSVNLGHGPVRRLYNCFLTVSRMKAVSPVHGLVQSPGFVWTLCMYSQIVGSCYCKWRDGQGYCVLNLGFTLAYSINFIGK